MFQRLVQKRTSSLQKGWGEGGFENHLATIEPPLVHTFVLDLYNKPGIILISTKMPLESKVWHILVLDGRFVHLSRRHETTAFPPSGLVHAVNLLRRYLVQLTYSARK